MLNLIAHILPDRELTRPWPRPTAEQLEDAAVRMDRLCVLGSLGGHHLDWSVNGHKTFQDALCTLDFTLDGAPAFRWLFQEGHFAMLALAPADPGGWPARIASRAENFMLRAWLLRLAGAQTGPADWSHRYQRFGADLSRDGNAARLADFLLTLDAKGFSTSLWQVFGRAITPCADDVMAMLQLFQSHPQAKLIEGVYPVGAFRHLNGTEQAILLYRSLAKGGEPAGQFLLDHGVSVNGTDPNGMPLLSLAIRDRNHEAFSFLMDRRANVNKVNAAGWPPLAFAILPGAEGFATPLLRAGANPFRQIPSLGVSVLALAKERNSPVYNELLGHVQYKVETEPVAPVAKPMFTRKDRPVVRPRRR